MNPKQSSNIPWWAIALGFMINPALGFLALFLSIAGVQIPTGTRNRTTAYRPTQRRQTPPAGSTGTYTSPDGRTETFRHEAPTGATGGATPQGVYHYAYGKAGKAGQAGRTQPKRGLRRLFKEPKSGKLLTALGAMMSFVFSIGFVEEFSFALRHGLLTYMEEWFPLFGFLCAGLFLTGTGIAKTRRSRRAKLYQGVIGQRNSVFLSDLAATAGVSEKKVMDDLQKMIADGTLPTGYIDRASGRLVLTDQGYTAPEAEPKKAEPTKAQAKEAPKEDPDSVFLRQIREVNDAIPDPEMSQKIARIEEITQKILAYQKNNPSKAPELRQFLNYYLPTTLKILNAYAQMDAQGIEGENISAAKARIEGMMDKVVEGFEKQLDQLFKTDAMDIATDVEVLERMLDKDGLGSGMTLGG